MDKLIKPNKKSGKYFRTTLIRGKEKSCLSVVGGKSKKTGGLFL